MGMYELLENYLDGYVEKCTSILDKTSSDDPDLKAAMNIVNQTQGGGVNPSYDKELSRLMYISKFTYFYGGLYAVMYKEIFELNQLKEILSNPDRDLKVLSVGCANQIDLWGLLFACEQLNINKKIKYVGCEIEENWKDMTIFSIGDPELKNCTVELHYGKDEGDIGKFLDDNSEEFDVVFLPSVFNELDDTTRKKIQVLLSPESTVCGITCHSDEDAKELGLDILLVIANRYQGKKIGEALAKSFGEEGIYKMPKCIEDYVEYTTKGYLSEKGATPLVHSQPMSNRRSSSGKFNLDFRLLGHKN